MTVIACLKRAAAGSFNGHDKVIQTKGAFMTDYRHDNRKAFCSVLVDEASVVSEASDDNAGRQ